MEAEPPIADSPKHKRRWFQFSLRSLLIVVTLLAAAFAYVGWQNRKWIAKGGPRPLLRLPAVWDNAANPKNAAHRAARYT
jgi:uncharacterized membrane protein YidH (DUF202 family)